MELFVDPQARQRIYVRELGLPQFADSDDWFEIYDRMPHKVRKAVEQAGLRARMFWRQTPDGRLDEADTSTEMDLGAGRRAQLYHSLLEWSFVQHGQIALIKEATIDMLDDELVEAMKTAVERHYNTQGRTEDEKKSPAPAGAGESRWITTGGADGSDEREGAL